MKACSYFRVVAAKRVMEAKMRNGAAMTQDSMHSNQKCHVYSLLRREVVSGEIEDNVTTIAAKRLVR